MGLFSRQRVDTATLMGMGHDKAQRDTGTFRLWMDPNTLSNGLYYDGDEEQRHIASYNTMEFPLERHFASIKSF